MRASALQDEISIKSKRLKVDSLKSSGAGSKGKLSQLLSIGKESIYSNPGQLLPENLDPPKKQFEINQII